MIEAGGEADLTKPDEHLEPEDRVDERAPLVERVKVVDRIVEQLHLAGPAEPSPHVVHHLPRVERHGEDVAASRPQYAEHLLVSPVGLWNVLQHIGREHQVERLGCEAQPLQVLVTDAFHDLSRPPFGAQVLAGDVPRHAAERPVHGAPRLGVEDGYAAPPRKLGEGAEAPLCQGRTADDVSELPLAVEGAAVAAAARLPQVLAKPARPPGGPADRTQAGHEVEAQSGAVDQTAKGPRAILRQRVHELGGPDGQSLGSSSRRRCDAVGPCPGASK